MRLVKGLIVVALAIAFTLPAFAETQSIKLSGDLTMRYISREEYDFNSHDGDTAIDGSYFMATTEVQLDADLTDNVSATVRVLNQRDINQSDIVEAANTHNDNRAADDEWDIVIDLAYVTMKEFFMEPLTVRIGRQDLWFGKGFIIGANYQDPSLSLSSDEWTAVTSFDAIRATWDFEPWTLDAVFAEIEENEVQADDDEQLYGVNLACDLSEYKNGEAEVYYWYVKDDEIPNYNIDDENRIHCFGARGSFEPHEDITIFGEVALQRGNYIETAVSTEQRDREAFAIDLGGELRLWEDDYAWRPVIGVEYIAYSGQNEHRASDQGRDYHGWNRMFRGKVDSAIHEWYNIMYTAGLPTAERADENLQQIILCGSVQPMDNLTVDARLINFRLFENVERAAGNENKDVGNEIDIEMTYEYTEDVTFGLLSAWFFAGDYYIIPEDGGIAVGADTQKSKDVASELVATCKVSF